MRSAYRAGESRSIETTSTPRSSRAVAGIALLRNVIYVRGRCVFPGIPIRREFFWTESTEEMGRGGGCVRSLMRDALKVALIIAARRAYDSAEAVMP